MKFIPVISKITNNEFDIQIVEAITYQSEACLLSLIGGLKSENFGLDTIFKTRKYLQKFHEKVIQPNNADLYTDSGGYSFIRGEIPESAVVKMIECYCDFLEKAWKIIAYIFSLDLPWSLGYPSFNTKEKVYKYNKLSLTKTFEVISKIPEISSKFYFVWQFRKGGQYQIWNRIYDELKQEGYDRYIKYRAIGGMVGIQEHTGINFAPFIALAYRCFKDYLEAGNFEHDFRLHLLGINNLTDRFVMAIMELLFQKYLREQNINAKIAFTYDSTSYFIYTNYNSRKMEIYDYNDDQLKLIDGLENVPENILREVYRDEIFLNHILSEIDLLRKGKRFKNTTLAFAPLSLRSENQIDICLQKAAINSNLADAIYESNNRKSLFDSVNDAFALMPKTENKALFSKDFNSSVKKSIQLLYKFHDWFKYNGASYYDLNKIIESFVSDLIRDPDKLS